MSRYRRGFNIEAAQSHLLGADRRLAAWMRRIGPLPPEPRWRRPLDLCDALARSILHQQLSGKAAATIVARVESALGGAVIDAVALAGVEDATLRGCGVSGNKLQALRDLARHQEQGLLPDLRRLSHMDHEQIIAILTRVRGIGRWTAEMLLMFRLGRPDLLPVTDLGIRKGAQRLDRSEALPQAAGLAERGARWAPFRTWASFYLWRIADLDG